MLHFGQRASKPRRMTVGELRRQYAAAFGEQSRSFHMEFLIRRISCRLWDGL